MSECRNRRATKPFDSNAIAVANKKQTSCNCYADRKKWMDAYIAEGGAWECADPANKKPEDTKQKCPPKKAKKAAGKVKHTTSKKADELIRKHLKDCAKKSIKAGKKIEGTAEIVGEPEWSQSGECHYGEDIWKTKKVNKLSGFIDKNGKVWIHKDRGNPATMIHEGIHKYSDKSVLKKSQPLNEGMTEYFTRLIADKEKLAKGRRNYQRNYKSIKALVDLVGEEALCKAYFEGNIDNLKTVVDKKQGTGTWDKYVTKSKDKKWAEATKLLEAKEE